MNKSLRQLIFEIHTDLASLAQATATGFSEVHERIDKTDLKVENLRLDVAEGFTKTRRDILSIKDTYATKEELAEVKALL